MDPYYGLYIALMSFAFTECFIKPLCLPKRIIGLQLAKHNFQDIGKSLSVADKYFLIHSLINHVELKKNALLIDYCQKNLNYTNVAHITTSSDLDFIIKRHSQNATTLELFDIIDANAKLTDCYVKVFTLDNMKK
jgi:hypothetical protein